MLFEVSCCVFYGVSPWALLLSSLKEVSKKGATVSTRWTGRGESNTPIEYRLFGDIKQRNGLAYAPAVAGTAPDGADSR